MTLPTETVAARGSFLNERINLFHTEDEERNAHDDTVIKYSYADEVDPYLNVEGWPTGEPLPKWVVQLSTACESLSQKTGDISTTQPFSTVVEQFTSWGVGEVFTDHAVSVAETAVDDFRDELETQITTILAQPLHVDYCRFVGADPETRQQLTDSTEHREAYATAFCSERYETFFEEFSVAGRLLVESVRQWRTNTRQLLTRVSDDREKIAALTNSDDPLPVVGVSRDAGDRHGGGKTVANLSLDGGRVVYKPRNVGLEQAFSKFAKKLNNKIKCLSIYDTSIINYKNYGWMEHINYSQFESLGSVEQYYERAGELAWIATLLGATDLHSENLIATPNGPVIVDAETMLMTPADQFVDGTEGMAVRSAVVDNSVLGCSLVPFYTPEENSDRSGYGAVFSTESKRPTIRWTNVGADAIDAHYESGLFSPEENFPRLEDDAAPPWLFERELLSGFERTQRACRENAQVIRDAVADSFSGTELRVLPRQSLLYQLLLDTLSNPEYLRDGGKYELKIVDELRDRWEECAFSSQNVDRRSIVAAERDALLQRDIPRFTVECDARSLKLGDTVVAESVYPRTPIGSTINRIERLLERNLERQRGLFRITVSDTSLPQPIDGTDEVSSNE